MSDHKSVRRHTYLSGTCAPNREINNLARHATMVAWAVDRARLARPVR